MSYNLPLLFIVGTPRAGTTYLQCQLLRLSGFVSSTETHYFNTLFSPRNKFMLRAKQRAARRLLHAFGRAYELTKPTQSPIEKFSLSIIEYVKLNRGTVFIEKTPQHLWYVEEIQNYFPQSIFLHIIRSRYENVRSLYFAAHQHPKFWGGSRSVRKCNKRWRADLKRHVHNVGLSNHIFIAYEQLINDPDRILRYISGAFGATIECEVSEEMARSVISPEEAWKANNLTLERKNTDYGDEYMSCKEFNEKYPLPKEDAAAYDAVLSACV